MNPSWLSAAYGWLMLVAIGVSLVLWSRVAKRDPRLLLIYLGGLLGAFFGAKLIYLLAEGYTHWHEPDRWLIVATGKSILGALLGGYAGVESAKYLTDYNRATGDLFALVVPVGVALGRIGCILNGCCLGRACAHAWFTAPDSHGLDRWPAAQIELIFNLAALGILLTLRARAVFKNQLFHLYLMSYGVFRFFHEFRRDTPRVVPGLSGYQIAAALVALLGLVAFVRRARDRVSSGSEIRCFQ